MSRKALGRGLNALLGDAEAAAAPLTSKSVMEISVERIQPNALQPRRDFPENSLRELADSIRGAGLLQPLLVRPKDGRYELVAGERRFRAAKLAGLEKVPALVRDVSDAEAIEFALVENLMREDLNPIEIAEAYDILQKRFHMNHDQIAERVGTSRPAVTNTLRLLRLSSPVRDLIVARRLTEGHARAIASIAEHGDQARIANLIIKHGWSVRQTEAEVVKWLGAKPGKERRPKSGDGRPTDPNVRAAILELERGLGTKVKISGDYNQGTIEVRYFSSEDLIRIVGLIIRQQ